MAASPNTNLQVFLRTYSTVPNAFINDLFAFYDDTTLQTDPVIDLAHVATWLNVRKDSLAKTLRESYKKGIPEEQSTAAIDA